MQRLDSQGDALTMYCQHISQRLNRAAFGSPLDNLVVLENDLLPVALHNQLSRFRGSAHFLILVDKSLQIGQTLPAAGHDLIKTFLGLHVRLGQDVLIVVYRFRQIRYRCRQALELILDFLKLLGCRLSSTRKGAACAFMSVCIGPILALLFRLASHFAADETRKVESTYQSSKPTD